MTIDTTYKMVGVSPDDMTREQFRSELSRLDSPALVEADASYDRLLMYPVSILALVAFAIHDSQLCTAGINVTFDTKNPGNTRSCQIPGATIDVDRNKTKLYRKDGGQIGYSVATPKGEFVRYHSFVHGWEDMAARLVKVGFDYERAKAQTIEEIVPIYAPPTDQGNKPVAYMADVVRNMQRIVSMASPDRHTKIDNLPVVWIPSPPSNFGGQRGTIELIVIHDIEGSAASGIQTLSNPARKASCHYVTDPNENRIVQMVGTKSVAWTAGDDRGNDNGLNIENPGFAGKPFDPRVINYCGRLTGVLAKENGVPLVKLTKAQANTPGIRGVCGHGDMNQFGYPASERHYDPGPTFPWEEMLTIARNTAGGSVGTVPGIPTTPGTGTFFPETNFGCSGGILRNYTTHGGVSVFGYPRSREFDIIEDGKPLRVQWFQRGRAEWSPGRFPAQHDVTWKLLGDVVLFGSLDIIADFRFHINDPGFRWAFVPMTQKEWLEKGHNIPKEMRLF